MAIDQVDIGTSVLTEVNRKSSESPKCGPYVVIAVDHPRHYVDSHLWVDHFVVVVRELAPNTANLSFTNDDLVF